MEKRQRGSDQAAGRAVYMEAYPEEAEAGSRILYSPHVWDGPDNW